MVGLGPAIHDFTDPPSLIDGFVQVVPIGIHRVDQTNLPSPWPVLERLLSLNGTHDRVVVFAPNQPLQTVASRESST
jgi:hypothetical protein